MASLAGAGAAKTHLLSRLIPELTGRGLRISTLKHTHHAFEIDKPGKDSHTHRRTGATEVLVGCPQRWALIHENRGQAEAGLEELIARMTPVDLILVEGFKTLSHDKIEVYRHDESGPLLCRRDPHIVALAADKAVPGVDLPRFTPENTRAIADFIVAHCGLKEKTSPGSRI